MFFEKLRYVKLWMFFVKPCHRNLRCSEFSREFVLSCLGWVPVSGVKVPATLSSARPQLCSWGWTFSTPLNGYSWLRCLSTVMLRPAHFSPVADHRAIYVSVLSPEKIVNPGSWDLVVVHGFVFEEDNIAHLRDKSLFFQGDSESLSCTFLLPEGVVEVDGNSPPGYLMLDWDVMVDFIPVALPEPEEYMVWHEGDSQGSSQG